MAVKTTRLFLLALALGGSEARAQDDVETPPQPSKEMPEVEVATGPPPAIVLPSGLHVRLVVTTNLSKNDFASPVSLSPDVALAVTDWMTVTAAHSSQAVIGLIGNPFTAFCITGTSNGCSEVYPSAGLDARFRLLGTERVALGADFGPLIRSTDPFSLALKFGAVVRVGIVEGVYVETAPRLLVAVNERDNGDAKELLVVPVNLGFEFTPEAQVVFQTGVIGALDGFGDSYRLPLTLAATYWFTPTIGFSAAASLPAAVAANSNIGGFDIRSLTLSAEWRNR